MTTMACSTPGGPDKAGGVSGLREQQEAAETMLIYHRSFRPLWSVSRQPPTLSQRSLAYGARLRTFLSLYLLAFKLLRVNSEFQISPDSFINSGIESTPRRE